MSFLPSALNLESFFCNFFCEFFFARIDLLSTTTLQHTQRGPSQRSGPPKLARGSLGDREVWVVRTGLSPRHAHAHDSVGRGNLIKRRTSQKDSPYQCFFLRFKPFNVIFVFCTELTCSPPLHSCNIHREGRANVQAFPSSHGDPWETAKFELCGPLCVCCKVVVESRLMRAKKNRKKIAKKRL